MAEKTEVKSMSSAASQPPAEHPLNRGLAPFEEFERMIDDLFGRGWMRPLRWQAPLRPEMRSPKVDVIDRGKGVLVGSEIAGVKRDDVDVSVSDSTMTIKGHTESEQREEKGDCQRCEIARGSFSRTVALPAEVDGHRAQAKFSDGLARAVAAAGHAARGCTASAGQGDHGQEVAGKE